MMTQKFSIGDKVWVFHPGSKNGIKAEIIWIHPTRPYVQVLINKGRFTYKECFFWDSIRTEEEGIEADCFNDDIDSVDLELNEPNMSELGKNPFDNIDSEKDISSLMEEAGGDDISEGEYDSINPKSFISLDLSDLGANEAYTLGEELDFPEN